MITIPIILGVLVVVICILGYTSYNLLMKYEKAEELLTSREAYIELINIQVRHSVEKIKELDKSGIYRMNDEVDTFFTQLTELATLLGAVAGEDTVEQ